MKHAITGPLGRILNVLDEATTQTKEITDEQAALVATAADPLGYWVIDDQFMTGTEKRDAEAAARRAEMEANRAALEAARLAAMPPEVRARVQNAQRNRAAYDAAAAVYEAMPPGKRAMWEPVRQAVAKAILAGDFTEAREILVTLPAIYEGAEEERQNFVALFDQLMGVAPA